MYRLFNPNIPIRSLFFTVLLMTILLSACGISASIPSVSSDLDSREVLYQVSTYEALNAGLFEGIVTIGQLKEHGDFGIGTTDGLNGEMVVIDGHFYRVRHDGGTDEIGVTELSPFAMVTFFENNSSFDIPSGFNYRETGQYIDSKLSTLNVFQAIRLKGVFSQMKLRSPSKQTKPYPTLSEALKTQNIFEYNEIEGVIAGWRFPDYGGGINLAGYHFHFLTADLRAGGHVLDFLTSKVTVSVDHTPGLLVRLPENDPSFDKLRNVAK
jgi:acetolactate decarboxylase